MGELSDLKHRIGTLEDDFKGERTKVEEKFEKVSDKQEAQSDKLNEIHVSVALIGQSLETADNIKEATGDQGLTRGRAMVYGGGAVGGFYGLIELIKIIVKGVKDVL